MVCADTSLVRTTRARIIHLRNDYKGLMSQIEAGLHAHHASLQDSTIPATSGSSQRTDDFSRPLEAPFAKVNSVISGSPADDAGLKAGDKIRSFGNANWMNHEKLSQVGVVVQGSEGVSDLPLAAVVQGFSLTIPVACRPSQSLERRIEWKRGCARATITTDSKTQLGWTRSLRLSPSSNLIPIDGRMLYACKGFGICLHSTVRITKGRVDC